MALWEHHKQNCNNDYIVKITCDVRWTFWCGPPLPYKMTSFTVQSDLHYHIKWPPLLYKVTSVTMRKVLFYRARLPLMFCWWSHSSAHNMMCTITLHPILAPVSTQLTCPLYADCLIEPWFIRGCWLSVYGRNASVHHYLLSGINRFFPPPLGIDFATSLTDTIQWFSHQFAIKSMYYCSWGPTCWESSINVSCLF